MDNFNYLGTIFNYTGSFVLNQEHLVGKALKALNLLLINCHKYRLKPKIICQLFDSFVGSILNYASEIWGFSKSKEIERIHLKFCKKLLKVKTTTCSTAVYGELARYPLYIMRYVKIIKYWFKLTKTDNIILQHAYRIAYDDCLLGKKNWLSNVKKLLYDYGFAYVWDSPETVCEKTFILCFKQRIIDNFVQGWHVNKENSPVLEVYNHVKSNFEYEKYLDILPCNLRCYLTKLRLSSHSLKIQTGRYSTQRIDRNQRYCIYCNKHDIEDEYHFILICPCYIDLRKKYIKKYYYVKPSMFKFVELLKNDKRTILKNLAIYIKRAMTLRASATHLYHPRRKENDELACLKFHVIVIFLNVNV